MEQQIKFQDNNDDAVRKNWTDQKWMEEFYEFLQGNCPDSIRLKRGHQPNVTEKKAWEIICYLQDHMSVLPDNIERCWHCGGLYDCYSGGLFWESKQRNYCDGCSHLVPENYDNCKRY